MTVRGLVMDPASNSPVVILENTESTAFLPIWIGVCEAFGGRVVAPRGSLISLVTDNVDACYQRLLARGLDIEAPARLEAFAIYRFSVTDPDGYRIEFQQFDS